MNHESDSRGVIVGRLQRLTTSLRSSNLDGLVVNPGPSLTYLTGLHFHLMERPVVAFFPVGGKPALVVPELEAGKLEGLEYEVHPFLYTEDLRTWGRAFADAVHETGLERARVGVEPRWLRVLELRFLEAAAPEAEFVSGEESLASVRARKDAAEIALMRKAIGVAQDALQQTLTAVREGVSERELAAELTSNMLRAGSASELPFPPIVGFGPNSANPHAVPTDRRLEKGELVLFDWGANVDGYFSDLTRVFAFGEPDPELRRIAEIVLASNRAGCEACKPGVRACDVDRAAREVIEKSGYGQYFIHRTGHGLGLEAHEEPYIRGDNDAVLVPGMTFTIEPGIYLPGRGGVRIEDNVAITPDGADILTDMPRELIVL